MVNSSNAWNQFVLDHPSPKHREGKLLLHSNNTLARYDHVNDAQYFVFHESDWAYLKDEVLLNYWQNFSVTFGEPVPYTPGDA